MIRRTLFLGFALLPLWRSAAFAEETVSFAAADGVRIEGTLYPAAGTPHGLILLFHQAGSNRGEYATIAPELAKLGWDALAIDQRAGGAMWGRRNETAARIKGSPHYIDALPDLEAALDFTIQRRPGERILLWGSSYSASLVFLVAARHPEAVAALLAFSPGEYFNGVSVRAAAANVTCPIFVTSASDAGEVGEAKRLVAAAPAQQKTHYVAKQGVHGSSTLREDRNPGGATANWQAVQKFLAELG